MGILLQLLHAPLWTYLYLDDLVASLFGLPWRAVVNKEEHLMHLEICWMTSHAVTLSVSSVSAGKALLESVIMHWAVYIWNWITLCSNMRGAEGHGATVLCKAISVMQRQPRAKPWPTQIRTRITTPLTHCSPASRPSKHPSQQHHTAAHCGVTAHRLAAS